MKTIGLIGGISWLSTIEYYRLFNQLVNDRLGGMEAARVIVYSVNFGEIKKLTMADDWDTMAVMMCDAATKLEAAGADCVLMGVNTMHRIADRVRNAVSIPFLHIAEAAAEAISRQGLRTVALLGTRYVMQQDFYRDKLSEKGIATIIPGDQADIDYINNAIYEEFGKGIFTPEAKQRFIAIIEQLEKRGAEGVVSGCTEIPLLLGQKDCTIPVFDTTFIHAQAAVNFALA